MSSERSLRGPHVAEGVREFWGSLIKGTTPIHEDSTLMT